MNSDSKYMSGNTQYQPPSSEERQTHVVAIIGWDDDKVTQAPEKGAWLAKDSSWRGFFWISYYDKNAGKDPVMGAVSFQEIELLRYDHIYYHDYHGWGGSIPEITEAINAFKAQQDELLTAISFYTADDSVDYELKVFDNFEENKPEDERLAQSGTIDHKGFHTIDLHSPVQLEGEDDFYIYLNLSHGGHPIDMTGWVYGMTESDAIADVQGSFVYSTASPGESYYYDGSAWKDLYDYEAEDHWWEQSANFCIKALTNDPEGISFEVSSRPDEFRLYQNYPIPFNNGTAIRYRLAVSSHVDLSIYTNLGQKVATLVSKQQAAGTYQVEWDAGDLVSGVYFCKLSTDQGRVLTKKMVLLK
jgi:hypothetical protein